MIKMYIVENTPKNAEIIEMITDIRSDIELFHREMTNAELDAKLEEIQSLEMKLQ